MDKNIKYLNEIYQYSQMGLIGIDDVYFKVENEKLKKELDRCKKEYKTISNKCERKLKKYHGKSKDVSMMSKITSELYSNLKLMKDHDDKAILKMLLEGTYRSIGLLTTKMIEFEKAEDDVKQIANKMMDVLFSSVTRQKKIIKFIE